MQTSVSLAFAFGLSCFSMMASAQVGTNPPNSNEEAAKEAFQQGRTSYEIANYEKALSLFEKALSLSGKPEMHFNIGQAQDKLGRDEDAIDSFETFIQKVPETNKRTEVEARLRILRNTVAQNKALQEKAAIRPNEEEEKKGTSPWLWVGIGASAVAVGVVIAILLTRPKLPDSDFDNVGQLSWAW